jgi:hypothetical protein
MLDPTSIKQIVPRNAIIFPLAAAAFSEIFSLKKLAK